MKKLCLFTLAIVLSLAAVAQGRVDSLISNLQDTNLNLLDRQMDELLARRTMAGVENDKTKWFALRMEIIRKTEERTRDFAPSMRVVVVACLAETLVREKHVAEGYPLILKALLQVKSLEGFPRAYVFVKYSYIFKHLNRYDSAIVYAEKVIDIAHELKSDSLEKVSLDQVSLLSYKMKNYQKAEYYFKRLEGHPLSSDQQRKDYFNTIALTFRKRAMYDSSLAYFYKARKIAEDLKDKTWLGLINGNIGYVYFLQKKYDLALPPLLADIDLSFQGNNDRSAVNALTTVASIYIDQHNIKAARFYYDSLLHSITRVDDPEVTLEFYKTSANYYEMTGDLKRANLFLRKYSDMADSVRSLADTAHATELEAQFDFDRQASRIQALEQQTISQTAENRFTTYMLSVSFIVILLGLGLLVALNRNNRFKQQTNKILQEQNARIREQADHLNSLNATKDKLFSIISHDLRGPINSLKALTGMLHKDMITAAEFKQFSGLLQNNIEYVHFTLDNVLYWSRSQLQGIKASPEQMAIPTLVVEAFNLLSEPLKMKNIQAANEISTDATAYADTNQIRLVFRNLISNALKFTDSGGKIVVSASIEGDKQVISVYNTGPGVSEEVIENLFSIHSGTTAGTGGEKGTGLGLSLCKEMVEINHGTIWVVNSPDGATFKFSLPVKIPISVSEAN